MAQSMDGHTIDYRGEWDYGSSEDKRRMDRLRSWSDYIITGRNSIDKDNPNLYVRSHIASNGHPIPVILLVSTDRILSPYSRIWNTPHPPGWIGIYNATEEKCQKYYQSLIDSMKEQKKHLLSEIKNPNQQDIDWDKKIERLKKWKIFSFSSLFEVISSLPKISNNPKKQKKILLEGGPRINNLFLRENLVDEIYFTLIPWIFGISGEDRIITTQGEPLMKKFRLINIERRDDEVFFRYKKKNFYER